MSREFCPIGLKILELLKTKNRSFSWLAHRTGYSRTYLYLISWGENRLTESVAVVLEKVLKLSAEEWLMMNLRYQLSKVRGDGPKRTNRGPKARPGTDERLLAS